MRRNHTIPHEAYGLLPTIIRYYSLSIVTPKRKNISGTNPYFPSAKNYRALKIACIP